MALKRIKMVHVAADEVDDCAAFWSRALDLQPQFRDGDRWVQFSIDGSAFAVASREEAGDGTVGATIVFEATDEQDHERLIEAGAIEAASRDMGDHGRIRTYVDPSSNVFQLFWRPARPSRGESHPELNTLASLSPGDSAASTASFTQR